MCSRMNERHDRALQRLRELQCKYRTELPDRIADVVRAARAISAASDKAGSLQMLATLAHKLAGTSGIFGFPEVSRAAGALERDAERLIDAIGFNAADMERICAAACELQSAGAGTRMSRC